MLGVFGVATKAGTDVDEFAVEPDRGEAAMEWEDLADRVGCVPFLHPGWVRAWSRSYGTGPLELHLLRREGQLAAVLPLERGRLGRRSPTDFGTPQFGILGVDRQAVRSLARRVLELEGRRLSIACLDGGASDIDELRAAAEAAGRHVVERTVKRSPYVELEDDVEAQVRDRLGAKAFSELRRRRRRLEERGRVELEVTDGGDRLDALLREGYALEGSGWKTAAGTSILARPQDRRFYTEIAGWASRRGILRLCFLRANGRAIAFKFALEENGALYSCKGGYDPSESRVAPGLLIVWELLKWSGNRGLARLELLGDALPWKLQWTDTVRERLLFEAFGSSPIVLPVWLAERYGRPAAKRLRVKKLVARARRA
jgi:CelD/BcsL family acetyltransferase involved in cellulose biosynthesis